MENASAANETHKKHMLENCDRKMLGRGWMVAENAKPVYQCTHQSNVDICRV